MSKIWKMTKMSKNDKSIKNVENDKKCLKQQLIKMFQNDTKMPQKFKKTLNRSQKRENFEEILKN